MRTGCFNGATTARAFMSLMVKSVTAVPTCAMMLVSWSYHSELRAAIWAGRKEALHSASRRMV